MLLDPSRKRSDDGPRERQCTDCFCALLLVLVLAVAGTVAAVALRVGDTRRLMHGVDYTGKLCGVGALADRPLVVYPRLATDLEGYRGMLSTAPWAVPLYGLCVQSCPSRGDSVEDYPCVAGSPRCQHDRSAGTTAWIIDYDTSALASRW